MKQISIYQVDETPIGAGGMGRVLRGVAPDGRQVAIKEIRPEFAQDMEIRARTEREVEMLQQLNNESIVKVYDQFPLNDNFYIVMELVDGLNVEQYVQKYGPIPYERATRFMVKILNAMQIVHEKNFVHRDMKPSNIMIRNDERICILDFGIAKDMNNPGFSRTMIGTILGSDGYMSPEQANGFGLDRRTDIYSLGCVFYFMLTGHHAYDTLASEYETASNIVNTPFPKLSKHSKAYFPDGMQQIMYHATDPNMMQRYQSCREFMKDLVALVPSAALDVTKNDKVDLIVTVGREACDILINDPLIKVSRKHLEITYKQFTGGRYYIITDHSSNGTMVNGKRLERGQSVEIPADGPDPQVLLACDDNYALDWNRVKRIISVKLKERELIPPIGGPEPPVPDPKPEPGPGLGPVPGSGPIPGSISVPGSGPGPVPVYEPDPTPEPKPAPKALKIGLGVLSIVIPILGLILALIFLLFKKKELASTCALYSAIGIGVNLGFWIMRMALG